MNQHLLDGVLARTAAVLALSISMGPVLWWGLVDRAARVSVPRWRVVAAVVLLAAAGVLGVLQATLAFAETWSFENAFAVLRDTRYGRVLAAHVLLGAVHASTLFLRGSAGISLQAVTASAVIVSLTEMGHAALEPWWQVALQATHTAAVVAWIGALTVAVERMARRTLTIAPLRRLARALVPLVALIVATGLARSAVFLVGARPAAVWWSALVLKLVTVAGALSIALGHRRSGFRGLRRADSQGAWHRMQTYVTLELWLIICATLLAALLSQLEPP